MALSLDEKIDRARVRQFASQMKCVPQASKAWLEETFSGEHSIEFYEGLLAAYANMYVMAEAGIGRESFKDYSGHIVAFVADQLEKKYKEKERELLYIFSV
jgi:hypothetical protein